MKFVLPFSAGTSIDTLARLLAEQIGRTKGPTAVIESRPGAAGVIATEAVAGAAPDGNTLLMTPTAFVVTPQLRKLNYDPLTSFEPVCYLVSVPLVIAVNAGSPYRTLADLLNAARAKPGDVTLASIGPGSASQVAFEMLKRAANVDMTFISYPGTPPAVNALLGNQVTSVLVGYAEVSEHLMRRAARARRRDANADCGVARGADRRRIRLPGLRGRHLVRGGSAGKDAEGNNRPTRRDVYGGDAGARGQGEACRPGTFSGRYVRR